MDPAELQWLMGAMILDLDWEVLITRGDPGDSGDQGPSDCGSPMLPEEDMRHEVGVSSSRRFPEAKRWEAPQTQTGPSLALRTVPTPVLTTGLRTRWVQPGSCRQEWACSCNGHDPCSQAPDGSQGLASSLKLLPSWGFKAATAFTQKLEAPPRP